MRALIIGGYGFVGRHLAQHLQSCGDDLALTYLPDYSTGSLQISPLEQQNKTSIPRTAQSLALDVRDRKAVFDVISLLKPDAVYHLAGVSHVPTAERLGEDLFNINVFGVMNVLDAIREHSKNSRFLFVSSAEVYGEPRLGALPFTELSELRPVSAYGVSKAGADLTTFKYFFRDGLHAVRVRPFPHIGPGQSPNFALSSFAKQVAEIKLGKSAPVIKVGNLQSKRDYTDVLDIVRGYRELMLNGKAGEVYNLCSGESTTIGENLQALIKIAGIEVEIVPDEERLRAIDIAEFHGSYQKANKEIAWKPRISRELSLESLFSYWLETLSKKEGKKSV